MPVSYTHLDVYKRQGYIYPCVAQDKPIRTEESLWETIIYKKTTTFDVDGYTYQCDVDDGSQFVTLYNKENKLTYKDIVYKATEKAYIGSWNSKVVEYDSSMSWQEDFIVDQAFTKAMADEIGKTELMITMLLSPNTVSYTHLDVYKRQGLSCFPLSRVTGHCMPSVCPAY